jgi:glycosyltransferase involved in cell wall biosynthesis
VIGLYCPDVPPVPGGVSDHTLALARALEAEGAPPVVLADRGDAARFAPLTCITGLKPGDVAAAAVAHGVTNLVVQYVPFLFARLGVSPALVRGVHRMHAAGLTLTVVVHEAFVPFTRIPWLITGVPQRLQYYYLVRRATQVYAPMAHYADVARRYAGPDTRVKVAPIGATIPVSTLSRAEARARLGLGEDRVAVGIFSPAASGFAHEWIAAAVVRLAGNPTVTWVRFGFGSARALPGYPQGPNVITVGETTAETVSDTMRALDVAAAPYTDGLTMRRSGAMLALAHGVPVVSSEGHLFDPSLRALAACEADPAGFAERLAQLASDPAQRASWAGRATGYGEQASMESLARLMLRDLEGRP